MIVLLRFWSKFVAVKLILENKNILCTKSLDKTFWVIILRCHGLSLLAVVAATVGLLLRAKAAVVTAEDTMCPSDTVSSSGLLCTEWSRELDAFPAEWDRFGRLELSFWQMSEAEKVLIFFLLELITL